MKKILIVENRSSGQKATQLDFIKEKIQAENWSCTHRCFESGDSLEAQLEDLREMDAVIGVGGDGTISGLAAALQNTEIPLLAYPGGTANLIAQNLFTQWDDESLWRALKNEQTAAFDLGHLKTQDMERFFIMAAGAGADATMIRDSESFKDRWGFWAYFYALWKQIKKEPTAITLEIDGETLAEPEAVAVLVANLSRVNFRLPLSSEIDPRDGLLDVLVLRESNLAVMAQALWHSVQEHWSSKPVERPEFGMYQGRRIKLSSREALPIQQDGEFLETQTPVIFEACPQPVHLFYEPEAQT